jgi:phage-related protein
METFSFDPIDPIELAHSPKVRSIMFGDGYEQRTPIGLNHDPEMWSLVFDRKLGDDVDGVYDFLKARGGHEAFYWTPPGEAVAKIYTCKTWKRRYEHYSGDAISVGRKTIQSITLQLEQKFEQP